MGKLEAKLVKQNMFRDAENQSTELHGLLYRALGSSAASSRTKGVVVSGLQYDPKQVTRGTLFVAVSGNLASDEDNVSEAIGRGAVAVVADTNVAPKPEVEIFR